MKLLFRECYFSCWLMEEGKGGRGGCWGMERRVHLCRTGLCWQRGDVVSPQRHLKPLKLQPFPSPSENLLIGWDPQISPLHKFFLLMEANGIKTYGYYQWLLHNEAMICVLLPRDEGLSFTKFSFCHKQDHKTIPNFLLRIILCLEIMLSFKNIFT